LSQLENLPLEERINIYREHASRMMRLARTCSSEAMRVAYLRLAAQWQSLVVELEQAEARRLLSIDARDVTESKRIS
jgi:hypothetical protein